MLSAFVILVPFVAVFASVTKQGAGYVILGLLAAFIIPVMSLSVSSVLAMPYYYVKSFLVEVRLPSGDSNAGAFCAVLLLCDGARLLKNPYVNGRNQVFFPKDDDDDNFVDENLVPANFIAAFTLKTDVWKIWG